MGLDDEGNSSYLPGPEYQTPDVTYWDKNMGEALRTRKSNNQLTIVYPFLDKFSGNYVMNNNSQNPQVNGKANAFNGVESVDYFIAPRMTEIPDGMFYMCTMQSVQFPALQTVGEGSFFNVNFKTDDIIDFPEVTTLSLASFRNSGNHNTGGGFSFPKVTEINANFVFHGTGNAYKINNIDNSENITAKLDLPNLKTINGWSIFGESGCQIKNLPNLETIAGDQNFTSIRGRNIELNLPSLKEDNGFKTFSASANALGALVINLPKCYILGAGAFSGSTGVMSTQGAGYRYNSFTINLGTDLDDDITAGDCEAKLEYTSTGSNIYYTLFSANSPTSNFDNLKAKMTFNIGQKWATKHVTTGTNRKFIVNDRESIFLSNFKAFNIVGE